MSQSPEATRGGQWVLDMGVITGGHQGRGHREVSESAYMGSVPRTTRGGVNGHEVCCTQGASSKSHHGGADGFLSTYPGD